MNANLYALIEQRMPADRSRCCIDAGEGLYYSWDDIDRATARIANLLASLKLPAGSRIAVQVENLSSW